MLRINLSTRPFYNERLVSIFLWIVILTVLFLTIFNFGMAVELSSQHTELSERFRRAKNSTDEISEQLSRIERDVNPEILDAISTAGREVDLLIERHLFSWTEFFNQIESSLPPNVMMTTLRPEIEDKTLIVFISVLARSVTDIDGFVSRLEEGGTFGEILITQEERTGAGLYSAAMRGRYIHFIQSRGFNTAAERERSLTQ